MILEPNCRVRKCRYFEGLIQPDGTELFEVVVCAAFPNGIPSDIAFGRNKHTKPIFGQSNKIVFDKKE